MAHVCTFCNSEFASKTQLFKHLEIHGIFGTGRGMERICLAVGWESHCSDTDTWVKDQAVNKRLFADASEDKIDTNLSSAMAAVDGVESGHTKTITRSSAMGIHSGSSFVQRGEDSAHAICDLVGFGQAKKLGTRNKEEWLEAVNAILVHHFIHSL